MARIDEYIAYTLYGIKNDTAKPPFKSLQKTDGSNGVRMTLYYYNQTYFPYNYTEAAECGSAGGLNYNWCMTEVYANATYREQTRRGRWPPCPACDTCRSFPTVLPPACLRAPTSVRTTTRPPSPLPHTHQR